jgi:hypothetical protein
MANALQMAGATGEPSNFAPLNTDRIFTGLWTNRNPMRDAATSANEEKYYGTRQDSILGGYNTEVSAKLTLRRRSGNSVYNSQIFPPITRFYAFNTFTLTDENILVLADTAATVYDATSNAKRPNIKDVIWQKSAGAVGNPTFFLGVGNNLYFTNGVDNKQLQYPSMAVSNWGIVGPTVAPTVTQIARPTNYPSWAANTVFGGWWRGEVILSDPNTNTLQKCTVAGYTGDAPPAFSDIPGQTVQEATSGGAVWMCMGSLGGSSSQAWQFNHAYAYGDAVVGQVSTGPTTTTPQLFGLYNEGTTGISGTVLPAWQNGIGTITRDSADNSMQWTNMGIAHVWTDIGPNVYVEPGTPLNISVQTWTILDPNGYLQAVGQGGKTGANPPSSAGGNPWNESTGGLTTDGGVVWVNQGPVAISADYPTQYGYAYENSATLDISNMSPPSALITLSEGNQVVIQGPVSSDPQVDTVVIYRILQNGSTFLYLDQIAVTPSQGTWTYNDTTPDSGLNVSIQAQVNGEGTPLPTGATCMEYHLGRNFVAVGNVVYISSGPDAVASGSSGNSGFDTTFTCQSKIIRFWVNSLGIAVFTVRDSYIILGSATDADPLYMLRWIENIPLLNYDAFSVFLTTAYLLTAKKMVMTLDPSAGIVEASQPIADLVETMNAKTSYLTFHSESSAENALYLSDGATMWYRLAPTSSPESGSNWSPQALITGGMSAVQSVEIEPGEYRMLLGPPASGGPILFRDLTSNTDDGVPFAASTRFGSVVVAQPGELAALAWMTLEAQPYGTAPALSILLSEINGEFENVPRTRQDPPNLPPSQSLYSNRHSFLQNQMPVWCRHFQFTIDWPAEDAANELLTFTIFGQTWQEMRSQ